MQESWAIHVKTRPVGKLALYWINAIAVDWRDAGEEWEGISTTMKTALSAMLEGTDQRTAIAETVLAGELRFLFEADPEWCRNNIMPLFDWHSPHRAKRAWAGFLTWGRFNDRLLEDGLLERYIETAACHTDQLERGAGERLYQHLAAIALVGGPGPLEWVSKFTSRVEKEELREKWIRYVALQMSQLPDGAAERQWNGWMETYWRQRINGPLRRLTEREASALATWVVELDERESIRTGVSLATSQPANLPGAPDLLGRLRRGQLARAPKEYAKLVAHLLKHTELPIHNACHDLGEIVQQLRELSETDAIEDIVTRALSLGCQQASQW